MLFFAEYPLVQQVEIRLKKPNAPIRADFNYVAVELIRGEMKNEYGDYRHGNESW